MTTVGTALSSLGIASGNTLEAVAAAYFINNFANGRKAFDRAVDVLKFVVLAGFVSTAISATLGVTSLALTGYVSWARFAPIWVTWWLGDAGGNIVAAPFFLLWTMKRPERWSRAKRFEAAFFAAAFLYISLIVFTKRYFPRRPGSR